MDLSEGTQLGQYRIVEQIGRGGMATVYKAFQPSLERYVAIKVLPQFFAEEASFLDRFRQEARAVSSLRHRSILTVFDYGEQDGTTFMVSEYLGGGTLESVLGYPVPVQRAVELIHPIAEALDYAHSRGMVHRDVKPSNILLDEHGQPVLTDFGVARMVGGGTRLTATGAAVGTPEYMAPEQASGEGATAASDQYALGIVLYEMLTGRTPFQAETPVAVALAHLHKPLPLPRGLNPALSEDAERVLLKALAKSAADRYPTCTALVDALGATLLRADSQPIVPAQPTSRRPGSEGDTQPPSRQATRAWVPRTTLPPPGAMPTGAPGLTPAPPSAPPPWPGLSTQRSTGGAAWTPTPPPAGPATQSGRLAAAAAALQSSASTTPPPPLRRPLTDPAARRRAPSAEGLASTKSAPAEQVDHRAAPAPAPRGFPWGLLFLLFVVAGGGVVATVGMLQTTGPLAFLSAYRPQAAVRLSQPEWDVQGGRFFTETNAQPRLTSSTGFAVTD
ncbi:MAG: serine/threonine protein kinase, partial [Chloroflexi bacterium]|nr:serine/threonine protein kinase [Chloroflexota bacterium]